MIEVARKRRRPRGRRITQTALVAWRRQRGLSRAELAGLLIRAGHARWNRAGMALAIAAIESRLADAHTRGWVAHSLRRLGAHDVADAVVEEARR